MSAQCVVGCNQPLARIYQTAVLDLCKMHIVPSTQNAGNAIPAKLGLNQTFKASLRLAIVGGYVRVLHRFSCVIMVLQRRPSYVWCTSPADVKPRTGHYQYAGRLRDGTLGGPHAAEGCRNCPYTALQTILHFMVSSGTDQSPSKPSQGVLHLLQKSGLMVLTMSVVCVAVRCT